MPNRSTSIERDNPFLPGGEIEKEVNDILRNSTISADKVEIVDPSTPRTTKQRNGQNCAQLAVSENKHNSENVTENDKSPTDDNLDYPSTKSTRGTPSEEISMTKKKKKKGCSIL